MLKNALLTITALSLAIPATALAQNDLTQTNNSTPSFITVTVSHGAFSSEIVALPSTVSEILSQAQIELTEDEFASIELTEFLTEDARIIIKEPISVGLAVDGIEKKVDTKATTVAEFLAEQEITLSGQDYTKPTQSESLNEGTFIEIIRKTTKEETLTKTVAFQTEKKNDATLNKGEQKVLQAGVNGSKDVTYSVIYENDVEVSRSVVSEKITKDATSKIVAIGTKEAPKTEATTSTGETRTGVATFYYGPTNAASHIYPKGSVIKITNTSNGKSITVTIDDYGGFGNRLVDLRKDHFQKIGNLSTGVLPVVVERIR